MKIRYLLLLLALAIPCLGQSGSTPAQAAFDRLKQLQGDWQSAAQNSHVQRVTYRVIANGSAVEETFNGPEGEMLTVYTLDGDHVLLTHFCMAHNQPRMQASALHDGTLDFHFLDATGLASPAAGHMHNASFHFTDENHFTTTWHFVENGKEKFTENMEFARLR
ncbi:MAG TPA: hypothetical protein VGL89_08120 [Candidatus Koribacter sp.]|jgi:hypothetical protein